SIQARSAIELPTRTRSSTTSASNMYWSTAKSSSIGTRIRALRPAMSCDIDCRGWTRPSSAAGPPSDHGGLALASLAGPSLRLVHLLVRLLAWRQVVNAGKEPILAGAANQYVAHTIIENRRSVELRQAAGAVAELIDADAVRI